MQVFSILISIRSPHHHGPILTLQPPIQSPIQSSIQSPTARHKLHSGIFRQVNNATTPSKQPHSHPPSPQHIQKTTSVILFVCSRNMFVFYRIYTVLTPTVFKRWGGWYGPVVEQTSWTIPEKSNPPLMANTKIETGSGIHTRCKTTIVGKF